MNLHQFTPWNIFKSDNDLNDDDVCEETDLPEYTLEQVSEHSTSGDCWLVIFDKVYDVTEFLHEHPGGEFIICEHAGRDATIAFKNTLHGKDAHKLMKKYLIGVLVEEQRFYMNRTAKSSVVNYADDYRGP